MTIHETLQHYSQLLKSVSDTAHLDMEYVLMHVMQCSRAQLFSHPEMPLNISQQEQVEHAVKRRQQGEPMAYITGEKAFWDLNLKVTPAVLIPRPETELLVEWVLAHYPPSPALQIADLGVGSGAIALAIAKERPLWKIDATDQSAEALSIAKENAKRHDLMSVQFFQGSWYDALPSKQYDILVSNPPYIAYNDSHVPSLRFEPQGALVSGEKGLTALRTLIAGAKSYLKPSGVFVFEHGYDQGDAVFSLCSEAGYSEIKIHKDLAGLPRFCTGKVK